MKIRACSPGKKCQYSGGVYLWTEYLKTGLVRVPGAILCRAAPLQPPPVFLTLSIPVSGWWYWVGLDWGRQPLSVSVGGAGCRLHARGCVRMHGGGRAMAEAFQEPVSLEVWGRAEFRPWRQPSRGKSEAWCIIRHLPPRANGKGVCSPWASACRDENQEQTAGFPATRLRIAEAPGVRRRWYPEWLSQVPPAVHLSILVSFPWPLFFLPTCLDDLSQRNHILSLNMENSFLQKWHSERQGDRQNRDV